MAYRQSPLYNREIDSKYPKSYCPSVKKDKEDANQEYRNEASSKDREKAKFYNPPSANQPQAQVSKKCERSCCGGFLALDATKVAKKDKDKAKDLSHIECYTYKQKSYYASRYLKKLKYQWRSWQLLCQ